MEKRRGCRYRSSSRIPASVWVPSRARLHRMLPPNQFLGQGADYEDSRTEACLQLGWLSILGREVWRCRSCESNMSYSAGEGGEGADPADTGRL